MTQYRMPQPAPVFTALTPNVRIASEYESQLRRMTPTALIVEYESVAFDFYNGDATKWLKVVEARREIVRRLAA